MDGLVGGEHAEGEEGETIPLSEIAAQLIDSFDSADTNSDGALDYDEARALIPTLTREQFDALDLNGDGLLTQEELVAAIPVEGEDDNDDDIGGCCRSAPDPVEKIKIMLGDWLLVGLSPLLLLYLSKAA